MPHRPRSHGLEAESRLKLAQLMNENNWVFEERLNDYGIDGHVEIFNKTRTTGKFFDVQIKATDAENLAEILKVSIEVETFEYWLSTGKPTCLVRYSNHLQQFFFRWVLAFPEFHLVEDSQKTVTVHFSESDVFNCDFERLEQAHNLLTALQSSPLSFKKSIGIFVDPSLDSDIDSQINTCFRKAFQNSKHFFLVHSNPFVKLTISQSELKIEISNVFSQIIKFPPSTTLVDESFLSYLPYDALCFFALELARKFKQHQAVGQILAWFFPKSSLAHDPDMIPLVSALLFAGDAIDACMDRAKELMMEQDLDGTQIAFSFLMNPQHPQEKTLTLLNEMTALAKQQAPNLEAPFKFNTAVILRTLGRDEEAYRTLEIAADLDPGYRERYHWQLEAGRLLFFLSRFDEAATAYKKGHTLVQLLQPQSRNSFELLGFIADCLLYAGQFKESYLHFKQAIQISAFLPEEFHLKFWLMEQFVQSGHLIQKRNPNKAFETEGKIELAPNEAARRKLIEECLRYDRLNTVGWHDLGVIHSNRRGPNLSHKLFFPAFILEPQSELCAVSAIKATLTDPSVEELGFLCSCVLVQAYRHHGEAIYQAVEEDLKHVIVKGSLKPLRDRIDWIANRVHQKKRSQFLVPTPWGVTTSDWLPPPILMDENGNVPDWAT
jgi:tetratricopeptide (TPR) repeat protein